MTLGKEYFLICDGSPCVTISPDFATPAELRRATKKLGWERLHNPVSVEYGYVDPNDSWHNRHRNDYCPTCAPTVREQLIAVQARLAEDDKHEVDASNHISETQF